MEYDWHCPGCYELMSWIEPGYYSEELDDNVCYECHRLGEEHESACSDQVEPD